MNMKVDHIVARAFVEILYFQSSKSNGSRKQTATKSRVNITTSDISTYDVETNRTLVQYFSLGLLS